MEALLREAKEISSENPPPLKEQIVLEHTPLIRYIVNRIAVRLPSHIDLDDLHNTGVIGLMDAIEKYDPEKNCKFKTYAEFRIKGAILDQLRSLDWVPRSVRQKSRRLERAYGEVETRLSAEGFLADQEQALATAATEATAARVLAEERYARGLSNLITLLESQRRAFDAQSRLLSIKRQRLDARVDLYLALGGGFNDSTPSQHAEVSQ